MREKLKNNSKIKIISMLSALVLWMYVMAVVDPEETKLIEDVPVIITNKSELKEKDLIIYPETELTANIYITGKLSMLQKIKKDDININGQINDPIEGKNQIYLKAITPQRVTYEFKSSVMIINLEKVVQEKKNIKVKVEGKSKDNVDRIELEDEKNSILVTGPRSLVDEVNEVMANLDTGNQADDFESDLYLKPVDEKGNKVNGVELEINSIKAKVTLLKEKAVPIKLQFTGESDLENNIKDYKLSQEYVDIKGKKEIIDKIGYISTQPVDLSNLGDTNSKEISLNLPEGVKCEIKYITVNINKISKMTNEFTYDSQEIQIRNSEENFDTSKLNIPQSVKVEIEYNNSIGTVSKQDIVLYIDLSQEVGSEGKYEIKYESKYTLDKVTITPDKTD
ncbi:CdaR family protein [Romboutsia sp.]|uniref:CdaR family protein n=1 Tax=Romboutsia sp. TaxID=1965302 RepID=UPI003F404F98